jgi:anaerobic dimethyl sulfoxide reductase subunit B
MQYGFYFDQTRCMGCFTCVVACRDWHDVPAGPASYIRLTTVEKGRCPDLFVAFLLTHCYHCKTPACMDACPANAIAKHEKDGIVTVDAEACLGKDTCGQCLEACPYSAPQFTDDADAKMQKCDLCIDRLEMGKKPVCVSGCPMRALDAAPIEELKAKYNAVTNAEHFTYEEKTGPSVVFKPKIDTKGLAVQKIQIKPEPKTVA